MQDSIKTDRLYNCDCMEFMKTMADNSVDMTLTDIPYEEVNKNKGCNRLRNIDKSIADEKTFVVEEFLEQVDRVTKGSIVIFCGIEQVAKIYTFFRNKGYPTRQIIWNKTNPSPMNGDKMYLCATENGVWTKKKGAYWGGHCVSNVLNYPTGSSEIHPTEKNHDLLRQIILENTRQGDLIFDPCSGSGSTLLVAGQEGRHFLGCEIHNPYFIKAEKRLKMQGGFVPQLITEECYDSKSVS